MRFTINREWFLKGLSTAAKASSTSSALAIFKNLKLSINEKGLTILGGNGELAIQTLIPVKVGEQEIIRNISDGEILAEAKIITEIARRFEGEELNFEIIDETMILIEDNKTNIKLNSIRAEEYPDIDLTSNGVSFDMDCQELLNIVDQTVFAASVKGQRAILTALNITIDESQLIATATDSARLAKKTIDVDLTDRISTNIAAKTLSEIVRLFEDAKTVNISLDNKKAIFSFGNTIVSTTLVNGEYPQTKNLVPKAFNYFFKVNAQELVSAMERVSLLSGERENVVKLTISEDVAEVAAKSSQTGSAKESINAFEFQGEPLKISFNSAYVIAAIKALKCEEVTIAFIGEMKPFVIKNDADDSIVQLVTPVRTY